MIASAVKSYIWLNSLRLRLAFKNVDKQVPSDSIFIWTMVLSGKSCGQVFYWESQNDKTKYIYFFEQKKQ